MTAKALPIHRTGGLPISVVLIATAGCVDAIGYLRLGHLFVSFMSGNTTQAAIALVHGQARTALRAAAIVTVFVFGVWLGRMITLRVGRQHRRAVLLVEASLLIAASLLSTGSFANVLPMVGAMGVQNAAWHKLGPLKTSRTYVTGALVDLGEDLADLCAGRAAEWRPHVALWLGMVAGAAAGAALYEAAGLHALFLPALAAICMAVPAPAKA
jgi:uncharacterized membrane protein YoaK (UPF0700 family)